jgi:CRISPR-associated protein Csm1
MNVSNLNPTVLKVAMAGFIHDLGKFIDINCLDIPGDYLENNAGAFLPVWNGKYSHRHALHTAAFIESMSRYLPPVCNDPEWGKGEAFIRLACAHHRPDSPMEWIITQADHISSGMDRETFDNDMNESVHYKDYQKTRLIPVFSHIRLDETQENILLDDIPVRYPLEKMTPHSIFPGAREEIIPGSTGQARKEYERLTRDFLEKLTSLAHRHHDTALWFEHFDSLLMQYTSSIPAARVGHVIPDVSLYDHMATTSALAAALYLYHDSTETLDSKHIKDNTEKKFLLINGDLYGIQNFIFTGYGDTRRYRSKLLRGRSFSVSLMLEMTADMLCRKIGLPHSSVILNAGGRFTILAPNTEHSKDAVKAVNDHVNEWLVKRTFGETCIGLCAVPASGLDFQKGNIAALWERMTSAMEDVKFSRMDMDRHGGAVAMPDYLEEFHNELSPGICPLCGKRPAEPEIVLDDIHVCAMCRDHVFLGEHLVKKGQLVICDPESSLSGKRLLDPLFNAYQVLFPETDTNALAAGTEPGASWENTRILKYWEINPAIMDSDIPAAGTLKLINGYVPFYTQADIKHTDDTDIQIGMPKTLNHIAAAALENADKGKGKQGIAALGILKADVDHLGLIMACGLGDNLYTISRIATLSRQFNNYFAVHLPALLENNPHFNDVYTVFAGGDDLFLIGPWNRIVELAGDLQASFRKYVCENKEIHFSAGITVHKAHTPMDVLAAASEEALEMSKKQGRNRITVFDQTVTWQQFAELKNVADEMTQWLDQQWITQVFFYNINRFIDMAEKETVLLTKDSPIHMQDMACTRWRSLLGYSVERNTALKISKEDRTDKVVYIRNKIIQWLDLYRGSLRIPLWTILYNRR